eukprot:3282963-Rhodomonas_salina.3
MPACSQSVRSSWSWYRPVPVCNHRTTDVLFLRGSHTRAAFTLTHCPPLAHSFCYPRKGLVETVLIVACEPPDASTSGSLPLGRK